MPKLGLYAFGERLLKTNDLDPVYVLLWESNLEPRLLRRWLLAYWCFYHCGTASWVTDQKDYWAAMRAAAGSKDYPRSSERRHFRGQNASKSILFLQRQGIDKLFSGLASSRQKPIKEVMVYVQSWVGFGPWIAFKVADMLERLGICPVQFDGAALSLFDSPREGADLAWKRYGVGPRPDRTEEWAVESILRQLGHTETCPNGRIGYLAPPRYERSINVQEAETVLCKWKSYLGGHYHLGEDIESCRKSLDFRQGKTARMLLQSGTKGGLW